MTKPLHPRLALSGLLHRFAAAIDHVAWRLEKPWADEVLRRFLEEDGAADG